MSFLSSRTGAGLFLENRGSALDLLFYPAQIVGHSGVDAGSELLGTAVAPADHPKQEEPVVDLTHQWPPGVPLQDRGTLEGPDPSDPA